MAASYLAERILLLIEPFGIEIWSQLPDGGSIISLLIEPFGIEIAKRKRL